ncbi:MAG: AsmA family protein [Kiritimatiellae bacterium]|nr:AsmA family protein [Kiritimatiellia bacterium]
MKRIARFLLWVVIVVLVLAAILLARLGPIIRTAVNQAGPKLLGVPVSVEAIDVNALRGVVNLKQLKIGNPEGFTTPHLFELEGLYVDINMRELLGGKTHVREIVVSGPHVWYERKLTDSNIGKLQDILAANKPAEEEKPTEEKPSKGKKQGVIIDRVLVKEGRIGIKMGVGGELPLPSIELKDIGKDDPGGVSLAEAVQRIVGEILGSVTKVIAGAGDLAIGGVKALGSGVKDGGKLVGESVGAAGEQAGKAVKSVGGALKKGVGGLLGGDKGKE